MCAKTQEQLYAKSLGRQGNRDAQPPALPPPYDWADSSGCLVTLPPTVCPDLHTR